MEAEKIPISRADNQGQALLRRGVKSKWSGVWDRVCATAANTFWPALTASPRSFFLYYAYVTGPTVLLCSHYID